MFEQGQHAALSLLGLEKRAFRQLGVPILNASKKIPVANRIGKKLKGMLPTWKGTKEMAIGKPREFASEVARGKAFAPGSLMRKGFRAKGMMDKAFLWGFPAHEVGSVMLDDQGDKARRVGEGLGSAGALMAGWYPAGMLGAMALDPVGRAIGGAVGQTAGHLAGKATGEEPATPAPTAAQVAPAMRGSYAYQGAQKMLPRPTQ